MAIIGKLAGKRIDWIIDPAKAGIDGHWIPTKEDFYQNWKTLNSLQKRIVTACVTNSTYGDIFDELSGAVTFKTFAKNIHHEPSVIKGIIFGRCCNQPSEIAKSIYIETLVTNGHQRHLHAEEIHKLVTTDREHLQELAKQLVITGDGKRDLLKELIAYGMQTKEHEEAEVDEATGMVVKPAVYTLADPRMALLSLQELNKIDHEYSDDEKATSSIESQAERVRRLKDAAESNVAIQNKALIKQVNDTAKREAKQLDGIARKVTAREMKAIELEGHMPKT